MTARSEQGGAPQAFDWEAARRRLERALARVEGEESPPPEEVRRRLRQRAAALAAPPPERESRERRELVVFRVGAARYAVHAAQAEAVAPVEGITPVPGLPSLYIGVISHRGAIYPLLDVRLLVGAAAGEAVSPKHAILVADAGAAVAIAADELEGFTFVDAAELAPAEQRHPASHLVAGVAGGEVVVIDTERLLRDARLVVDRQPAV